MLVKLTKMNEKFELLQRALEKYLETKRHIFPRFYFVSNDDMLEILGNSKKPEAVQPHLKKLFDNLVKIKIQKNLGINKQEAIGMYSDDGEYVEFSKVFFLDGPSEMWLSNLETSMRTDLRTYFRPCRSELKKMLHKRDRWLLTNIGQLCNACSLVSTDYLDHRFSTFLSRFILKIRDFIYFKYTYLKYKSKMHNTCFYFPFEYFFVF